MTCAKPVRHHRYFVGIFVAAAVCSLMATTMARADFQSLSQKVPASANSVVAINVAKLLKTPFAQSEQWAQNSAAAWANQPVMIPKGSTRLLMAADVNGTTLESVWECSLIEMAQVPELKSLAAAEGGYIDRVWDKDAVCSPINAYFVPLDSKVLASVTPANRSAIAKWLRAPATPQTAVTSDYIKKVLATLNDQSTDIVMAMDLEGVFGVPRIRRWLDDNDIKEIPQDKLDEVARTLGTMDGITLTIQVDKDVSGRTVVDFGKDASSLSACAKPVMVEVLNTMGMRIDDIGDWKFATAGKQVTMEGKLSAPALRTLLSIVQSPIPAATTKGQDAAQTAPGNDAPADPAQASQRYFKVITTCLDNFRAGSSPSETANWARATSKRIDQLPILNVDPALVQWGTAVSTKLKQAGGTMAIGQTQMNARVAGIMDPAYTSYSYSEGTGYTNDVDRVAAANAKSQRRQAALEQRAASQQQALQIINELAGSRAQIRQQMVDKYKVEF